MTELLRERTSLAHQDIVELIRGDYLALRVPDFYAKAQCDEIVHRVLAYPALRDFKLATHMRRYGPSLGESTGSESAMQAYLDAAGVEVAGLRELCAPCLTPIDKLRLGLDETWAAGARLGSIHGRKAFTGVVRVVNDGGSTEPHQDKLIAPDIDLSSFVHEQLAANVYLRTSESGGELELWNLSLPRPLYQTMRAPGKAGVLRERVPPSDLKVQPRQGELILFRSTCLHAICPAQGGQRITCATFIGYQSEQDPLVFYC